MAKLQRVIGTTSQILQVFIQDSSVTTGAGLTGLTSASSGLTAYYMRNTAASPVAVSLTSMTAGTFTSAGFVEVSSSHMPGVYQLGIPNAALVTGADSVVVILFGATNMAPVLLEIELTATNVLDGVRFGLSALPNGPMGVKKNQALPNFSFPMFDTSGNAKTGLTVTAQRRIDSGSFAGCANSVTEVALGWYTIDLAAADLNGAVIALRFSSAGALDTDQTIVTQA